MFFKFKEIHIYILCFIFFLGWAPEVFAKKAKDHGENQLQRLINAHPVMEYYYENTGKSSSRQKVSGKDAIWQWVVQRWDVTEENGKDFYFNTMKPFYKANANIILPKGGSVGYILMSERNTEGPNRGKKKTFEEMWHDLVFVLLNKKIYPEYSQLVAQALQGQLEEEAFIRKSAELQYYTYTQVLNFYTTTWLPWVEARGVESDPGVWQLNEAGSYENWSSRKDKERFYKEYYKDRIKGFVERNKR